MAITSFIDTDEYFIADVTKYYFVLIRKYYRGHDTTEVTFCLKVSTFRKSTNCLIINFVLV